MDILNTAGTVLRSDEQIIQIFATIAKLRGYPATELSDWAKGDVVAIVLGGAAQFDGTYGIFAWNPNSAAADDGVNVIKPTAFTTPDNGRWILIGCECNGRIQ